MSDDQLDKVLYGQILKGTGPWSQGPIMVYKRKLRRQYHDKLFGNDKCPNNTCPVCRKFIINV